MREEATMRKMFSTWAPWLLLGGAVVALSAVLLLQKHWAAEVSRLQSQEGEFSARLAKVQAEPLASPKANFVDKLQGQQISAEEFVRHCQAAANRFSVAIGSVNVSPLPATVQTLGRHDVALTVHGAYGPFKHLLAEILERHPSAVLQQLSMRRNAAPNDLEMQVTFTLLRPPLTTPDKAQGVRR
jgi:hypothetical protein